MTVLRAVDEQETAAAGACQCALRDPGDEGGAKTGVDRVAAVGEDARSGLRRQRVPGCDGASHGAAISSGGTRAARVGRQTASATAQGAP
ncbi:MAG: hypothetical protein K0R88_2858 [Solirubrobacterales bacterium]|nr:hypothetical protein [Solirubrobacterales bacterium]